MIQLRTATLLTLFLIIAALPVVVQAAAPAAILKKTGVDKGLVVYLGQPSAEAAAALTNDGRNLVHVIVKTEVAAHMLRRAIAKTDASGFVTVDAIEKIERLPFSANFVNGIYIDKTYWRDAGPSDEDIQRVLVPDGISYDGASTWKKPWPETMDDWTHFHYDTTNNPISKDGLEPPLTSLKWIKWFNNYASPPGGRGHVGFGRSAGSRRTGFRSTQGMLYYSRWYRSDFANDEESPQWYGLSVDAFNGTPKWARPTSVNRDRRMASANGKIFTWVHPEGKIRGETIPEEIGAAIDLQTNEVKRYPNFLKYMEFDRWADDKVPEEINYILHTGDRLFNVYGDTIREIDLDTGEIVWQFKHGYEKEYFFSPAYIEETNRIYVALTELDDFTDFRVTKTRMRRVLAIDADPKATGNRQVWMNDEFVHGPGEFDPEDEKNRTKGNGLPTYPKPMVSQVLYADGLVILFGAANQGPGPFVGAIRDKDNKLLWTGNYHEDDKIMRGWAVTNTYWPRRTDGKSMERLFRYWARHAFVKDGVVYCATSYNAKAYDIHTGKRLKDKDIMPRVPNQRCNSPRATQKYFVTGMTLFVDLEDKDRLIYQQNARSACGTGAFPAYNMLFYTESTCACFVMLRGEQGYGPLEKLQLIPNADRLLKPAGLDATPLTKAVAQVEPDEGQKYRAFYQHKHFGGYPGVPNRKLEERKNLIVNDWVNNSYLPRASTPTVKLDGHTARAWVHEHIVEVKKGGAVAWRFVTGGRISRPPIMVDGKVYVGCHDGYVYCLDLASGKLLWKFLAALDHRKVNAYGQLESAWPVYGVLHHEGRIYLTAGRHPDVDGGIVAWALDAKTGEPIWNKRVKVDMTWRKRAPIERRTWTARDDYANGVINDVVQIKNGKLTIPNYEMEMEGTLSEIKQLDDAVEVIDESTSE